jgi:hypothetical protein
MHLSKFTVLIGPNGGVDLAEIEGAIEFAIGAKLTDDRSEAVFEVRGPETTEVTLATIQGALDERVIDPATDPEEKKEIAHAG